MENREENRDMNNSDAIEKAFLQAADAYETVFGAPHDLVDDRREISVKGSAMKSAIGPMAAEIYRQMTRIVIVTVKEPKVTVREAEHIRNVMLEAGYRGIVTVGDVEYKFPEDDDPVEVTIEGKEDSCGNDENV
jgi:hypothetical protein